MEPLPHGATFSAAAVQQSSSNATPEQYGGQDSNVAVTAAAALSQQSNTGSSSRKRRQSGAPSSRGVANLTPEQLAKKRANDREAQRAIRERTRSHIDTLEARIRDLESQQPYQELQRALQERDRALADCDELRRRLAQVVGIAGGGPDSSPVQGQPNLHELANVTAQQSPLPPLAHPPPQQQQYASPSATQSYDQAQANLHPDLRSPTSLAQSSPASQSGPTVPVYSATPPDTSKVARWSPNPERTATSSQQSVLNGLHYDQYRSPLSQLQTASNSNGERLGLNFLLERASEEGSTALPPLIRTPSQQHTTTSSQPIWSRLPLNGPPTCPLDSLLAKCVSDRREQIALGASPSEVLGPDFPTFAPFLPPDQRKGPVHPLSALLIDILYKFPSVSKLAERVAIVYVVFLAVRWRICPCKACFDRIPSWYAPIDDQFDKPHAVWMDYMPWPILRSRLTTPDATVAFEEFFLPYTETLSLNWPYPDDQALQNQHSDDDSQPIEINPAFEAHLRDLGNWSLGSKFKRLLPSLVDDTVRIVDHVTQ